MTDVLWDAAQRVVAAYESHIIADWDAAVNDMRKVLAVSVPASLLSEENVLNYLLQSGRTAIRLDLFQRVVRWTQAPTCGHYGADVITSEGVQPYCMLPKGHSGGHQAPQAPTADDPNAHECPARRWATCCPYPSVCRDKEMCVDGAAPTAGPWIIAKPGYYGNGIWMVQNPAEDTDDAVMLPLRSEAQAIAVRDALNRVATAEET